MVEVQLFASVADSSENPNISLKNQVFYRQDYLDEFESIWEKQAKFHKELTEELKHELRDIIIFYQRPLKSQKGLINYCEFESSQKEVVVDGKKKTITIGLRVCPKSSPLFQCFKIWQSINNLQITGNVIPKQQLDLFGDTTEFDHGTRILTEEEKLDLYRELSIKESLSESEIIKLLFGGKKGLSLNFHKVEGNRTMATFIKACHTILVINGYNDYDFSKISYDKTIAIITQVFDTL